MSQTDTSSASPKNRKGFTPDQLTPIVPREFVTKPFFPAKRQNEPRVIEYQGCTWEVGVPRLDGRAKSPPYDMRHGRVCFALLTFRERLEQGENAINFSINELAHRVAHSNGGRYSRDLLNILFDLRDTWVRKTEPDGEWVEFTVIESVRVHGRPVRRKDALRALDNQQELWLDFVNLNPDFFGLLKDYEQLARFRFDIMKLMQSDIAQCIYAFLPSRAVHHDKHKPFEIRLSRLMEQIGLSVPKYRSKRKERFTQNDPSILKQLDGAPLLRGKLRVRIVETADGEDFKLQAWAELPATPQVPAGQGKGGEGKLMEAWLSSGRTKDEYFKRIKNAPPLTPHQTYLLAKAGVKLEGSEDFLRMVGGLLGSQYLDMLLSEMKSDQLEGRGAKSATKLLIHRLMKAVSGRD